VLRGLLSASRSHFSDNGCVSVASQSAEGQRISCAPRSIFRCQFYTRLLRRNRTAIL